MEKENGKNVYFVPSGENTTIKADFIQSYKECNHDTFGEFVEQQFCIWKVEIVDNKWKEAKCSCPRFFKNYSCKHTLGLAIRLGYTKAP